MNALNSSIISNASFKKLFYLVAVTSLTSLILGCGGSDKPTIVDVDEGITDEEQVVSIMQELPKFPADYFNLSHWSITLPIDNNNNGSADSVDVAELSTYSHENFFYLDDDENLVFAAPNKATTTANSSNTRSELRQMLRGDDTSVGTTGNNFVLSAHENALNFASIGSRMSATLKVDHVARTAVLNEKYPAYSVVVGQIHAGKFNSSDDERIWGWGNEPLKIYFKKYPNHNKGSVFWTYERNLPKEHPDRTDIAYPVWGNTWDITTEPSDEAGIALGEVFSYEVNVHENTLYLTFSAANHSDVAYEINLANNIDAFGNVDDKDLALGYSGDYHYFKAGAYNQCSTSTDEGFWYAGCTGTGNWETDKANGDYAQVTFLSLTQGAPQSP